MNSGNECNIKDKTKGEEKARVTSEKLPNFINLEFQSALVTLFCDRLWQYEGYMVARGRDHARILRLYPKLEGLPDT